MLYNFINAFCIYRYRQFGGHKNRENKSLKIDFYINLVDFRSFRYLIHVRLTIQIIRVSALLDKKLFIYLMQNRRPFIHLMPVGDQRTLEQPTKILMARRD